MKSEVFLRAVGDIDDALILEAETYSARRRVPRWVRWAGAAAACLICAVGLLAAWPAMKNASDNASMDCAPEAEWDGLADKYYDYAADMESIFAENSTAGSASGIPAETTAAAEVLDTGEGYVVRERTFWFREGDSWRKTTQPYPDGLPSMQSIVSDYLAAAGSSVKCTAARYEVVGEKDEILPGGIVQHTVGVTTWYVTLDGDVPETVLMGLTNTVLNSGKNSSLYQVHVTMPGGTFGPVGAFE